jgi:hypothetical protein
VTGTDGSDTCYPTCTHGSACLSTYGQDFTCELSSDLGDNTVDVCGVGYVGAACAQNSQCASTYCNGAWCTGSCTHDSDCGSGNYCVEAQSNDYLCFPGCPSNAYCAAYGSNFTCQSFTSIDGATADICSL